MLIIATLLLLIMGIAHSCLGERYVLIRLAKHQVLTAVGIAALGSAAFPLYFARGKHLSWVGFVIVGFLVLAARGGQ